MEQSCSVFLLVASSRASAHAEREKLLFRARLYMNEIPGRVLFLAGIFFTLFPGILISGFTGR